MIDELRQDVAFGLRAMLRAPLTAGAAVVSLALGIGAATAMFGALDVWLIRPLPLPESERLVRVFMANWETGWTGNAFSGRDFLDWRQTWPRCCSSSSSHAPTSPTCSWPGARGGEGS